MQNSWGVATRVSAAAIAICASACGAADDLAEPSDVVRLEVQPLTIDIHRSLVVTEQPILQRFSFQRVLDQLVAQSGVTGLTAQGLFAQWWDTQNPQPGVTTGPHCDDVVDVELGPVLNGYPYICRPDPSEGGQATCDPFAVDSPCAYIPIGLFNRFDLSREDGAHCGEYRIVYAKASGLLSTADRNLIIFEASMPNPHPQQGLKGCKPITDFWTSLSDLADLESRAAALEDFYFEGQGVVAPVISVEHFGDNALGTGQVRTNQFIQTTTGWSLREFKLFRTCAEGTCTAMTFVSQTVKGNPFGRLFDPLSTHVNAPAFRAYFPTQVASLAGATLGEIDMEVPDVYNSGQSQSSGITADEMRYVDRLSPYESDLRTALQTQLTTLGSALTPDEIVRRAQTTTCAGCHRLTSNAPLGGELIWPSALGFVHVSERNTEVVDGVTRYQLSDALNNVLLPARKEIFEDYINGKPIKKPKGPTHPISGRHSHG